MGKAPCALYEALRSGRLFSLQLSFLGQKAKPYPHLRIPFEHTFSLQQNHIWQRKVSPIPVKPPCHRHIMHLRQLARLTKHLLLDGSFPKCRNRSLSTTKACLGVPSDGFIAHYSVPFASLLLPPHRVLPQPGAKLAATAPSQGRPADRRGLIS